MQVNDAKSAELVARLETLPFSKWHRNFFILGFIGVMFDAADFALFGAALPPISREFGLGPAQAGLMATVGLVGRMRIKHNILAPATTGHPEFDRAFRVQMNTLERSVKM